MKEPGAWRSVVTATGVSVLGDQLAKVAISVLVFERTGSAALTAVVYGLTLLPEVVGGLALGGLADRWSRRDVMVGCAGAQAFLVAVMAVPRMPFAVLAVAVAGVAVLAAPARAAQAAAGLDLLGPARNGVGLARLTVVVELAQLAGLGGAAVIVADVGTTWALAGDAVSFAGAALLLRFTLPVLEPQALSTKVRRRRGWGVVRADRTLRTLAGLALLVSLTMVPDGVMAPLVHQMRQPVWLVGVLLAADCVGVAVGAALVARLALATRRRLVGPLAVLTFVPLLGFLARPGPVVAGVLLVLCGVGQAYLPLAKDAFSQRVPAGVIASANALVGTGVRVGQGVAAMAGGAVALLLGSPAAAVALAGVVGLVLAAAGWRAIGWRAVGMYAAEPKATVGNG
ncbi:MAG TPA: MFS transporter [Pseudonocardiaceae bacterium]|nr:MFS transporter [Pseudonocardiaceae bacterium]